jgi:hypothetical protein
MTNTMKHILADCLAKMSHHICFQAPGLTTDVSLPLRLTLVSALSHCPPSHVNDPVEAIETTDRHGVNMLTM